MRPQGERGVESETAAANEVTGLLQGVSLLWTRPFSQKRGERGPAFVICRDGRGRVAADEVGGGRGEPGLPPRTRPQDGRRSRLT